MKKIYILFAFLPAALFSQSNVNVLSYYASDNSMDGQPVIEEVNVLRFFPVFAISDSVKSVTTTIYYGPNIYTRPAVRQEEGKYWETLLPVFNLGEAIQRIEVKVQFSTNKYFREQYEAIQNTKKLDMANFEDSIKTLKKKFGDQIKDINSKLQSEFGITSNQALKLQKAIGKKNYKTKRNSFLADNKSDSTNTGSKSKEVENDTTIIDTTRLDNLILSRKIYLENYKYDFSQSFRISNEYNTRISELTDKLKKQLLTEISDTNYTGPGIRKSDITISEDFETATILYRNYNYGLRRMPALDPGERMGIFRVRYVPFPITATPDNPQMTLLVPFQEGSPAAFEIGLAFGGDIVPSDKHVNPVMSWSRLGVAFAITEKLFKDDAQIIALALTYDFNSYGSLGFGANLAQGEAHPYASFGINKKAFEEVVKGLASLF
jgi:hypothetical protein